MGRKSEGRNKSKTLENNVGGKKWQGVDYNINSKKLYKLLESASSGRNEVSKESKKLLNLMRTNEWKIRAGLHKGGYGGAGRPADPNPHITLRVGENTYHLGVGKTGRIVKITK